MLRILKNIVLVFLLTCAGALQAQQLKVIEFRADMSMTDATKYPKNDYSGNPCGLIKLGLALPVSDVSFEGDTISTEYKEGEWWIYMPRGSNWLTIKSKSSTYLPLRYEFEGIQSNVTYVMTVEKPSLGPEPEVISEQYLIFQIKPADAVLEVNDQLWTVSAEGTARKFVSFGTYSYRVQAPNYYPETGTVTVNDPKNKKIVNIDLKPNFGWVEVNGGNVQGAAVYVDNAYIGKAPCKSEALKSGDHTVRIAKEMYAPYSEKVTVSDNETTTISPTLTADFARVTLTVDADAEIWVNEEKKGTRTWTGNLATGTYRIECRLANHEPSTTTKEITNTMEGQTITLAVPKPIYGSLNIESTPDFAKIYVDGKPMGETPNFISQLLIGEHELKLTKEGYADYKETITIVKGERKQVQATLSNGHNYVDLGLPSGILWATCNVGAYSPEDYGDYFAWGETQPKDTYNWSTYQYANGTSWYDPQLTKYCNKSNYGYNGFTDNLTTLLPEDDAATANWGIDWRMPTEEEWEELYNNTTVTWTTQNGVDGRLLTASNGNSLFLPAAGYRNDSSLYKAGSFGDGDYWSSSLYSDYPNDTWILFFGSFGYGMGSSSRYYGQSVRAVRSSRQN